MGALSYYLEREGLMTTGISLVRENTASMKPPRALWVPFPLGRPLGIPADAAFQHRVIKAGLNLLSQTEGPVLEDFPVDVPVGDKETLTACPVAFPEGFIDDSWQTRLSREYTALQPWYEMSLRRREGRTLVGISDLPMDENIQRLAGYLDRNERPDDIQWLKPAVEDLKAYYHEAMSAQPGTYDAKALFNIFWRETQLGTGILQICDQYQNAENPRLQLIARMLATREAVGAATGPQLN